jgi:hypothetical protein
MHPLINNEGNSISVNDITFEALKQMHSEGDLFATLKCGNESTLH